MSPTANYFSSCCVTIRYCRYFPFIMIDSKGNEAKMSIEQLFILVVLSHNSVSFKSLVMS